MRCKKRRKISHKQLLAQQRSVNSNEVSERALLLAIIERALADLSSRIVKHASTSTEWIFHSWDPSYQYHTPFSFPWTCEQLDLDPRYIQGLACRLLLYEDVPRGRMKFTDAILVLDGSKEADEYDIGT